MLERAGKLAQRGRIDEAIDLLQDLPATAATLTARTRLLRQRGSATDLDKADRLLVELQRLLPHSAEPRLQRAEIRWQEKNFAVQIDKVSS